MNKLTGKQQAFIRYYTDSNGETYNNATLSAIAAGYERNSAKVSGHNNITNYNVKVEIDKIIAKKQEMVDYNYETAIKSLDEQIQNLKQLADKGNIQAIQATTALLREKNDIAGLHKQRWVDETEQKKELDEAQQAEARRLAQIRLKQDIA